MTILIKKIVPKIGLYLNIYRFWNPLNSKFWCVWNSTQNNIIKTLGPNSIENSPVQRKTKNKSLKPFHLDPLVSWRIWTIQASILNFHNILKRFWKGPWLENASSWRLEYPHLLINSHSVTRFRWTVEMTKIPFEIDFDYFSNFSLFFIFFFGLMWFSILIHLKNRPLRASIKLGS